MTDDIAKIAAGLTKAQRDAVLVASPSSSQLYTDCQGHVRRALFCKGVFEADITAERVAYTLTSLGLAVRAYLLENTDV